MKIPIQEFFKGKREIKILSPLTLPKDVKLTGIPKNPHESRLFAKRKESFVTVALRTGISARLTISRGVVIGASNGANVPGKRCVNVRLDWLTLVSSLKLTLDVHLKLHKVKLPSNLKGKETE